MSSLRKQLHKSKCFQGLIILSSFQVTKWCHKDLDRRDSFNKHTVFFFVYSKSQLRLLHVSDRLRIISKVVCTMQWHFSFLKVAVRIILHTNTSITHSFLSVHQSLIKDTRCDQSGKSIVELYHFSAHSKHSLKTCNLNWKDTLHFSQCIDNV